jgi:hypothetical protein
MSLAEATGVFIMLWFTALFLTVVQRARFGLQQRIRERLGPTAQTTSLPPPFVRAFVFNLFYAAVLCVVVIASVRFWSN